MQHTAPSTLNRSKSWVAKCSATYGEKLQSSNRVGNPWCCARLSQFHTESPGTESRCAYLRKLRSRCPSCRAYGPVSYTHLRAHETPEHLVCRLLLEKKKKNN